MIPEHYTDAERAAYAQARADASRDFQTSLTAGMRPTQDAAWCAGYSKAMEDHGYDPTPPDDRPFARPAIPQGVVETRCDPCAAGKHGNCQGHTVSCWCPCSDDGAADGGRLG